MYATFRPSKGNTITLKLLKCLCIILDTFLLLFTAWNIVNICYPFWGWTMYAFIWAGFVPYAFFYWLIKRFSIRSFVVARFQSNDQLVSNGLHDLKHCGFLFSVWDKPDCLALGYYHKEDQVNCLRKRHVFLGDQYDFNKWVGWLIVLLTDAIPFALLAALSCASYFFGLCTIIFFLMGFALAGQLHAAMARSVKSYLWKDRMFLDGKMGTPNFLGFMMCVLEGPESELLLTHYMMVMFNHYTRRTWFVRAADNMSCTCCSSLVDPVLLSLRA